MRYLPSREKIIEWATQHRLAAFASSFVVTRAALEGRWGAQLLWIMTVAKLYRARPHQWSAGRRWSFFMCVVLPPLTLFFGISQTIAENALHAVINAAVLWFVFFIVPIKRWPVQPTPPTATGTVKPQATSHA